MTVYRCPSCGQAMEIPEKPEKVERKGLSPWLIGCLVAAGVLPVILAVFGLLAAIAIPSFVRAREVSQHNACINNMRMLDGAKEMAAMDHNYREGDTVPEEQLSEYLQNGFSGRVCPAGGYYTIHPLGADPECSEHGSLSDATDSRRPYGP